MCAYTARAHVQSKYLLKRKYYKKIYKRIFIFNILVEFSCNFKLFLQFPCVESQVYTYLHMYIDSKWLGAIVLECLVIKRV